MPVAAIESLIALLSTAPPSTISETLSLLANATENLKASVSNPIALSAGTDLFQRYIVSMLQQQPSTDTTGNGKRDLSAGIDDFQIIRTHLLGNSRLFAQRAKEARGRIAEVARKFVRDGCTVLTCGQSRVVAATLRAAAEAGAKFKLVHVDDSSYLWPANIPDLVADLRRRGVPVATIPFAALASALSNITSVIVGAESVVENGGIISSLGTYQMGLLAKSARKPFYVVAESNKFVRVYPLNGNDLPMRQNTLDFKIESIDKSTSEERAQDNEESRRGLGVDFTPPDLITCLITESGVHNPSAVSEELIKMWY